jgi:hypothetical protein
MISRAWSATLSRFVSGRTSGGPASVTCQITIDALHHLFAVEDFGTWDCPGDGLAFLTLPNAKEAANHAYLRGEQSPRRS